MGLEERPAGARKLQYGLFLALAALAFGTLLRAYVNADEPFWFDEVWTGTIALQDLKGALDMILSDIIAPLYYLFIWAWAKVFGLSNLALRAPGMILTILAPIFAWLLLRRRLGDYERSLFTILIALWIPGLYYAQEARSYGFMFFGAVLQTVCFFRAVQSGGDRRDIAGWALAGLFLCLTHYTALLLSAVQGFALLALFWRARLGTLVLAGLVYAPALAGLFLQSDTIGQYADDAYFWLKPLALRDLVKAVAFLAGDKAFAPVLILFLTGVIIADARLAGAGDGAPGAGIVARTARRWRDRVRDGRSSPLFITGGVSALALALYLAIAVVKPIFLPRYLIPYAPGLFLLLVWFLLAMPSCRRWAGGALAGLFFLAASAWAGVSVFAVDKGLSWEEESAILASAGASDVLFFLDQGYPIPYRKDIQSKVYSFYFDKHGVPAKAHAFMPDFSGYGDPRPRLARFLAEKPGRAVIWTLHPGPVAGPIPADQEGRTKLVRERGFSAVYAHTALHKTAGVSCRTTGAHWYRKYVCYSAPTK
jgi:Dolichyl-phosphate-mannose-protein mannosyltransferase